MCTAPNEVVAVSSAGHAPEHPSKRVGDKRSTTHTLRMHTSKLYKPKSHFLPKRDKKTKNKINIAVFPLPYNGIGNNARFIHSRDKKKQTFSITEYLLYLAFLAGSGCVWL